MLSSRPFSFDRPGGLCYSAADMIPRSPLRAARGGGIALVAAFLAILSVVPAARAEYPRRIAIAPFAVLTAEEIRPTVSILPRLLSSRVRALSGAEVLLLPEGEKPPGEAAREAGMPLLLTGSVAKLGKGYSIDLSVQDLAAGKPAGAFFAEAPTEDGIIPALGDLAAQVVESLFDVKTERRAAPPPAPAAAAAAPVPVPVAPAPATPAAQPPSPAGAGPAAAAAASPEASPGETWIPTSLEKVAQSDQIAEEVYGVAAGDVDPSGDGEVIAWGERTLHFYKVKGKELLPGLRLPWSRPNHIVHADTIDLDGDGSREIVVTNVAGETIKSFVLKRNAEGGYSDLATEIPYFLVVLPDWEGKRVVAGQKAAALGQQHPWVTGQPDSPFGGKFHLMEWDGKTLKEGKALPHNTGLVPLNSGILGLSSARFGDRTKLLYTDTANRIRILKEDGESEYKGKDRFGMGLEFFEWGLTDQMDGKRPRYYLRKPPRVLPDREGRPVLLVSGVEKGWMDVVEGSYDETRVVLLRWDGTDFVERAVSSSSSGFFSGVDCLIPKDPGKRWKAVASFIEQERGAIKAPVSRLILFEPK